MKHIFVDFNIQIITLFLRFPFAFSYFLLNILLRYMFTDIANSRFYIRLRDKVPRPYTTVGKIISVNILRVYGNIKF